MSISDSDEALPLRWKDKVLQLPIVRSAIMAHGVADGPLPVATFNKTPKSVLELPGYFGTATVHAIRRALGKKLDGKRSRRPDDPGMTIANDVLFRETHRGPEVSTYQSKRSSRIWSRLRSNYFLRRWTKEICRRRVPTRSHRLIQGFSQFREKGFRTELPAKEKARINEDPRLLDLQKRTQFLQSEARNYKTRAIKKRLAQFQLEWVRQRRDWKIDTRGKERPEDDTKTDLESALSRIMPERGRLARMMLPDRPTTEQERKKCIADLCSLTSQDSTAFTLHEEGLVNEKCPVADCERILTR